MMRRLVYLFAILLISSEIVKADETITVSATNSDISANLDLKIVAKLFGEAKDLEDFENRLNDPQKALVNLDLNGDGDVDYIRVIETNYGNKHLIVLQAVLAKDIYQDVASIYVERDEANNVSVQLVGDEYIYGTDYVIEPIYIYRPIIYDWFWSPYWVCYYSPWHWDYWPGWWYHYSSVHHHMYYDNCYAYHHHHSTCSFRYAREARPAYREMASTSSVSRRDYAVAHPERNFTSRNTGMTNARQLTTTNRTAVTTSATRSEAVNLHAGVTVNRPTATVSQRAYGSSFTSATRPTESARASQSVSSTASAKATVSRPTTSSISTANVRSSVVTTSRPSSTAASQSSSETRMSTSVSTNNSTVRPSSSVRSSTTYTSSPYSGTRTSESVTPYRGSQSSGTVSAGSRSSGTYSGSASRTGGATRSEGVVRR